MSSLLTSYYYVPSANVSVEAMQKLFSKLEPFKLSRPELMMICNIRPEAYAHLTALIANDDVRFDENQLVVCYSTTPTTLHPERGNLLYSV